jgi:RNA polymerase sigma-70 factor (ECF subfamily)
MIRVRQKHVTLGVNDGQGLEMFATVLSMPVWLLPFYRRQEQAAGRDEQGVTGRTLTNEDLCELMDAIAVRKDRQAFGQLFAFFAPRVKGFGIRRGVDPAAAEEIAQESLLTVWRKAETFDRNKASVATWVFTIVRNKHIDMFRRHAHPEVDIDEMAETADDAEPADHALASAQVGSAVREAMRSLPAEQLLIIQKAFYEDKSHRAIADELGLPLGTVKSRIRLALARMRGALPEAVHDHD